MTTLIRNRSRESSMVLPTTQPKHRCKQDGSCHQRLTAVAALVLTAGLCAWCAMPPAVESVERSIHFGERAAVDQLLVERERTVVAEPAAAAEEVTIVRGRGVEREEHHERQQSHQQQLHAHLSGAQERGLPPAAATQATAAEQTQLVTDAKAATPCVDGTSICKDWANAGECSKNMYFMQKRCPRACGYCTPSAEELSDEAPDACKDTQGLCADWAKRGECTANAHFMARACRRSCGLCEKASS